MQARAMLWRLHTEKIVATAHRASLDFQPRGEFDVILT
jgi:hypothetical protein